MAGGGVEVARAYVTIIPRTDGTAGKVITDAVRGASRAAESEGAKAGANAGKGFSKQFTGLVGGAAKKAGIAVAAGFGAATAATGLFAKGAVEAGRSFDASMSQVAATMGKSVDEIGDLRDFAQEMGAKTAFSASQSADALNYMALAGYDAKTSMEMLPNVLNLAAAGGMELADASDMVTDTQSALGLSLEQTSALVDQMAAAASKTNTSVAQLGSAFLTVGGTAKSLKGGTVEAAQALGLLADNGVKGSEGGTALRNILLGIASDKFDKTFGAMGVAAYDAEGNMRSLKDVFADMNAAMADMTVEEKTEALSSAFNKVDLKSVNALLATDAKRWDEVSSAIADSAGAAQKMADTQLDNLEGDITIFQSALEGLQITFSDAVTPALREFVQFGTSGLGELNEALKSPQFKQWASSFAEGATEAGKGAAEFLFGAAMVIDQDTQTVLAPAKEGFLQQVHEMLFGVPAVINQDTQTVVKPAIAGMFDGLFEGIDFEGIRSAFQGLGDTVAGALGDGSPAGSAKDFGSALAGGINLLIPVVETATPVIGAIAGAAKFLADNAGVAVPVIGALAGGFMAFQGVTAVAGAVSTISAALGAIGLSGGAAGVGMTAAAAGEAEMGAAAAAAGPSLLEVGAAVLMIGGGVALAALGIGLLAQSAIALAESGSGAVGVMAGLGVGIAALVGVAALAGPALTAGAVGMVAFGAAVLLVGAGVAVASAGVSMLAAQLPTIAAYGTASAAGILAMGAGLLTMGAGALVAGAGLLVMAPAMLLATAAMVAFAPAMGAVAAASAALGGALGLVSGAVLDVGRGAKDMGDGLEAAAGSMPQIADNAVPAGAGVIALADAMGKASKNLGEGSAAMSQAGSGAQALAAGVAVTAAAASQAAGAFRLMGSAASSLGKLPAMAVAGQASFSALATAARTSFTAMGAQANLAVTKVKAALASIPKSVSVKVSVSHGSAPYPVYSVSGELNPSKGTKPTYSVSWHYLAEGGILTQPVFVAGEAGPEAVLPLSRLESMLDESNGKYAGGDVNVYLTYDATADAEQMARDIARNLKRYRMAGAI